MSISSPLQWLSDWITYSALHLSSKSMVGMAANFFIFDVSKIFILLVFIIFSVSVIRSFLPPEKVRNILTRKNKYTGNIVASLFGMITPFCSCSAIPLFLGFIQVGVPTGVTISFLIASPMINEVALVLLFGLFGWKIAVIYIVSGLFIAVFSGVAIGQMKPEKLIEPFVFQNGVNAGILLPSLTWRGRFSYAWNYTFDIIKKVWIFVVIGIGAGALIHGYVPTELLARYAGSNAWYGVPLAVLIGIPLYSNAVGVIPLVSVLTEKGVSVGTALAFMMSVTALSLPEFMILRKVMKIRLILIFAGTVALGIMFTGYLFNWILG